MSDESTLPGTTYADLYRLGKERLTQAQLPEAALDARLLLEWVCNTSHHTLYAHPGYLVGEAEKERYLTLVEKRITRVPTAYLTGETSFMGLTFRVSEDVLIPGQDTEIVAEAAMKLLQDDTRLLDLCTGSGCIALSLLHYSNRTEAVATDVSLGALAVAEQNARALGLCDRVNFVQCDLFPEEGEAAFDLLVSNPPYIRTDEIDSLAPEVSVYEPRIALDGGTDGLVFYRRIFAHAGAFLRRGAFLLVETGYDQAEDVAALARTAGLRDVAIVRDYGGNNRMVKACYY